MHLIYFLLVFLLCFFGALSNVGGFVLLKLFSQQISTYTLLEFDMLISFCIFLISLYHLLRFRKSTSKVLTKRTELVIAMSTGAAIGSLLGTLLYFHIYYNYDETTLISIQNIIIFTLAINSLLYLLARDYVDSFDIRAIFPSLLIGICIGFFCSLSNAGLVFFVSIVPFIMFDTSYEGSYNASVFIIFFSVVVKIMVTYLISPIELTTIPYFLEVVTLSFLANFLGTYFKTKLKPNTMNFLYILFLAFTIIISTVNFI